jgi:hypothetical protein
VEPVVFDGKVDPEEHCIMARQELRQKVFRSGPTESVEQDSLSSVLARLPILLPSTSFRDTFRLGRTAAISFIKYDKCIFSWTYLSTISSMSKQGKTSYASTTYAIEITYKREAVPV